LAGRGFFSSGLNFLETADGRCAKTLELDDRVSLEPNPSEMNTLFRPAPTEAYANGAAQLPSPWAHALHKPVFITFLVPFLAAWITSLLGIRFGPLEVSVWFMAATTSLVGLARRLPAQNIVASATLIGAISLGISVVGEKTGIPFGPRTYTPTLGAKIWAVPCSIPLLWLVVVINARGVARLIMRPWRKTSYYGFRVIGLSALLAVLFDAGLEPFAAQAGHYWFWTTHSTVLNWYSAPWANFLGWFVTVLAILGFTTPWLINKQPLKQPTDFHPLVVWLLLNLHFATGSALAHSWTAVAVGLLANTAVTVYTVRGGRW